MVEFLFISFDKESKSSAHFDGDRGVYVIRLIRFLVHVISDTQFACISLIVRMRIQFNHAKKFCSETTVWESCYKLVVTPQVVSVFIPIDLTKWNRFHSFLNALSKKKAAKAN